MHHIHFVGIKGVAMTALAVWAKEKGYEVSGSDVAEEFPTDEVLKKIGISVCVGFSPENVRGDMVVYTGAHGGRENCEVIEATKRGILCLPHGKALGECMKGRRQISVAGCHGKTTTTAMIATIFMYAGHDPSYAIGSGEIRGLGLPGHYGNGEWFIAEADEYVTDPHHDLTPRFLWQDPELLVITSIDYDHPDVYESIHAVAIAYQRLAKKAKQLVMCADDQNIQRYLLSEHFVSLTYGEQYGDLIVEQKQQKPFQNNGMFYFRGENIPVVLRVPGKHNLLNAAAAFLIGLSAGIDPETIINGLHKFGGASRRFEYIGEKHGVMFIDDYAHHPAEIAATIAAVRSWYPDKKLMVLFQPHTYSRTKALLHEFGKAFVGCDAVGILPIYASAREKEQTIDAADLVKEIRKHTENVELYSSIDMVFQKNSITYDIMLSLGAGDIGRKMKSWIH